MDVFGSYHGLRVGSALLSIVAGCIIIGVSRECDADAVGGIFLGAGGLGLLIAIYPFIKAWLNVNHILPSFGKHADHLKSQLYQGKGFSSANTTQASLMTDPSVFCRTSADMPDVLSRRKLKPSDQDLP
uniref:Kinocilin n=1 Tax=Pundamilia nyererei TaxID=303518 RepID=A0A3B4G1R5_9CICH